MPRDLASFGYCTNVHAGADLTATRAQLAAHAVGVRRRLEMDAPLRIGLWLSASSARSLLADHGLPEFAAWLREHHLSPYTFNGFPYGDFHRDVVKHDVYLPAWHQPERLEYTRRLIRIQHALLPANESGTISTLPIAWAKPSFDQRQQSAQHLKTIARELAELHRESGRHIAIALEPEPGCTFSTSGDAVDFFREHLFGDSDEDAVRNHLGVCHDVCHAVVMFEDQREVLQRYSREGIAVPKIQISSAVCMRLDELHADDRAAAIRQFASFREPRYLHQTTHRARPGSSYRFFEDLPAALEELRQAPNQVGEWRTHFHVPIHVCRFGRLEASQSAILECLSAVRELNLSPQMEVETYAWGVLPDELREDDLASGIAHELRWFSEQD